MSSEALERAQAITRAMECPDRNDGYALELLREGRVALDALLAEVARLEQERDEWKQAAECAPTSWADVYGREHELREAAEAALAVAREREQRLREALSEIANALPATGMPWAGERARAALVDEPAAASGSASAEADEPGETP